VDNTWPQVTYISMHNQQAGRPADPGIAPDESFMVFTAINLPGGYGHRDIYLTLRLPDGTWSKPRNLGPRINTTYIEQSPRITPDKKYLFFTRSDGWDPRKHSADIYWVELKEYLPESYR
jgi:Tol biopolymer transport system component